MLKLAVSVYRRPKSKPAFPAVTFPPQCMVAAEFQSGQPMYALVGLGIAIVCRPERVDACESFLAGLLKPEAAVH